MAFEIYTPQTLPLRTIQAIAQTGAGCVDLLKRRGLDARNFEFERLG